jgi:hypothetical protein
MSYSSLTWSERPNWGLLIRGAAMGLGSVVFFVIGSQNPQIRTSFFITGVVFIASAVRAGARPRRPKVSIPDAIRTTGEPLRKRSRS